MSYPTQSADGGSPPHDGRMTSLSLLEELKTKKAGGGERLNHLYGPLIFSWCASKGVASQHFDDIRQDVFLVVIRKIAEFKREYSGAFRSWLRAITGYVILEHFRAINGRPCAEGGTDAGRKLHAVPAPVAAESDANDPKEVLLAFLHRALELIQHEFSARHWEAFRLVAILGWTAPEAGRKLGMTKSAVRQAVYRMHNRLRQIMGDG